VAATLRTPEPPPELLAQLGAAAAAVAGMQPSMLDQRGLAQTLKRRMEANRLTHPHAYFTLYNDSPEEQSLFLEGILNNETSFFRDANVFAEMSRWCLLWLSRNQRPLRILSAPCSTGEEPYSIAAMLVEAGVELDRFTLDALDLSTLALDQARAAIYTGFSLRNIPNPEQSHFLEPTAKAWRVKKALRHHVHFRQANLLSPDALAPDAYDLICSRNLLIYQSPEARRQIAANLAQALSPSGRLILGAADWGRDLDPLFRLEEPIPSFALSLRPPEAIPTPTTNLSSRPKAAHSAAAVERPASPRHKSPGPQPQTTTPTQARNPKFTHATDPLAQLAHVTALYRQALEAFLRNDEPESERLCRQTLYLEPDHLPSLELLAKINRPHATGRMTFALHARLKRHRTAAAEGVAP
jgi:chemotaxis protein methyltransferase WspC